MKRSIVIVLLGGIGPLLAADEPFDASAAAKTLAPFIDEQTFAVARLDLNAVAIDDWAEKVAMWTGTPEKNLAEFRKTSRDIHAQLRRAGANEIYAVLSLADLPTPGPFLLITTGANADTDALNRVLRGLNIEATWSTGGIVAAGAKKTIDRLRLLKASPRPDLAAALGAIPTASAQIVFVPSSDQRRVFEEMAPELPKEIGGRDASATLSRGVRWAALGVVTKPKIVLTLIIQSQDTAAAEALAAVAKKAVFFAAQAGTGLDLELAPLVPAVSPKITGDRVTLSLREDDEAMIKLLAGAGQKTRGAAMRSRSMNNLKQLALAMHNYHDVYGKLPAHAIYSKDGHRPLLSWRVAILPFIDHDHLYKQFKLDEPWDSDHNKALIPFMPKVYLDPMAPPANAGHQTHYQLFVGGGAAWERNTKQPTFARTFTDGTSNTIMIAQASDPVTWTKPDDLEFDAQQPLPKLGVIAQMGFLACLADGSVRVVAPKVSEKTRKAAITAAGGETLGPDW